MLFNSVEFAIFLPVVFFLYWFIFQNNLRLQNFLIVLASYVFYGWWDWRFLSLIVFSTIVDYSIGIFLSKEGRSLQRSLLLYSSVVVNLGFLGFFKYYNFFAESFTEAFSFFGRPIDPFTLNIVLPVGISFYTFQTLSYTIDVYRRNLEPTRDIIAFTAFVSFFPQLVAGPIERATNLLPQFYKKRSFEYDKAVDGMRQILWGLFKKIVIADNCAVYANDIFNNYEDYNGSTLLLGAVFFAFQIYGDFSGYSDIAIGTSRLFGFDLMRNFAFPYFSRDIAEFWRRWHISLSTWFRDYLYIPLGGSKGPMQKKVRNIFIIFIVSGFWHGANWTFIIWGALNALYFLPLLLLGKNRSYTDTVAQNRVLPSLKELFQMGLTFGLTIIAWVFFRAESVGIALSYLNAIFSKSLLKSPFPDLALINMGQSVVNLFEVLILFLLVEWLQRSEQHALGFSTLKLQPVFKWIIYYTVIVLCFVMNGSQQDFIYFQF